MFMFRKNLCINPEVRSSRVGKEVDSGCHKLTASHVRMKQRYDHSIPLCSFYEVTKQWRTKQITQLCEHCLTITVACFINFFTVFFKLITRHFFLLNVWFIVMYFNWCVFQEFDSNGREEILPPGVYNLGDLRRYGKIKNWCPYFMARYTVSWTFIIESSA